jgi:hypothetical protein
MSRESLLKKEFKEADVKRVRNLVNKDFTSGIKQQAGYTKIKGRYKEGDVWKESGKEWTIKNGIKQNITKLDSAKKAVRLPLACPRCSNRMKKRLDKKMFKIHGFCFDCVVDFEANLKQAGLYEDYEKKMMSGNIKEFIVDIEAWVTESLQDKITMVTEAGDKESWGGMSDSYKDKITDDLQKYISRLRKHVI